MNEPRDPWAEMEAAFQRKLGQRCPPDPAYYFVCDEGTYDVEDVDDGGAVAGIPWGQHYVDSDVVLHLHMGIRASGFEGSLTDYCAMLQVPQVERHSDAVANILPDETNVNITSVAKPDRGGGSVNSHDSNQLMLVAVVESTQQEQWVRHSGVDSVGKCDGMVRLHRLDGVEHWPLNMGDLAGPAPVPLPQSPHDREIDAVRTRRRILPGAEDREAVSKVVEAGAEVIQGVAQHQTPLLDGGWKTHVDFQKKLAGTVVNICGDSVRVDFSPSLNGLVQRFAVFLRSPQLTERLVCPTHGSHLTGGSLDA